MNTFLKLYFQYMTIQNKNCSFHLFNSSANKLKRYNSSKSKKLMLLKRLGYVLEG
jgi:hypothetical protein